MTDCFLCLDVEQTAKNLGFTGSDPVGEYRYFWDLPTDASSELISAHMATPRCACKDAGPDSHPAGSGSWSMPCQKEGVKLYVDKRRHA